MSSRGRSERPHRPGDGFCVFRAQGLLALVFFFSVFSCERHVTSVNLSWFSRFVCVFSLVVRKEFGVDRSPDWSAC